MAWRVAKSIAKFQNQTRPLAVGADPNSFGTIGDTAHTSTSDHSPHDFPGWGNDIVTAGDIPKFGNLHPRTVLDSIRRSKDPRVKYAISEGQMFSSYPAHGYDPFVWRPYQPGGDSPDLHFDHGHLSVVGDKRADDERPWQIATSSEEDEMGQASDTVIYELRPWTVDIARRTERTEAAVAGLRVAFDAFAAALKAGGGNLDTAAILARINEVAAVESSMVLDLQAQLADRDRRLAEALANKPE